MTDPNETAEPSGASGGSVGCPYVTGNVTRYCTLTPLTLTEAEREAVEWFADIDTGGPITDRHAATLRGLLDRTQTGGK